MNFTKLYKSAILLCALILYSGVLYSQQFPEAYYNAISNADSLIINGAYKDAAMHYDSVFKSYNGKGTRFNRYIAAYLWNMVGNADKAFYYLFDVANEGSYYTISLALKNDSFLNLHSDVRWKEFHMKVNSNKIHLDSVVPSGYFRIVRHGFEILVNQFASQNYKPATDSALIMLDEDLLRVSNFKMKIEAQDSLRKVRIFLDWDAGHPNPQVHADEDWLIQNGYIPEKVKQLEISNMRNYIANRNRNQPYVIMHEMSHAYHEKLTDKQKELIKATYDNAMKKALYQSVKYNHGDGTYDYEVQAYASTNEFEYFAEITIAYFGSCEYFPFNRKDLRKYDPLGYKLVKAVWIEK